ncbi:hypothetical protein, partial [Yersinia aldovae]|uniref:hypothetical protein n=1 Tax=Yersinia aldovae TaxID=29483 RepID=UPI001C94D69D
NNSVLITILRRISNITNKLTRLSEFHPLLPNINSKAFPFIFIFQVTILAAKMRWRQTPFIAKSAIGAK